MQKYDWLTLGVLTDSAFSKTQLVPELWRVLSYELPAVFLHTPLEEKGPWGPLYQLWRVLGKGRHLVQMLLKALLTTHCQHSRWMWHLAGIFISLSDNRTSQVMMFLRFCQMALERSKFIKCLVSLSALSLTASMLMIMPFKSIIQEQLSECKFTELDISLSHNFERLNWAFTWNQTFTLNFPLLSAKVLPSPSSF